MASSSLCYYKPNPTMNSATITAEPKPSVIRQDLPMTSKSKYISTSLSHNYNLQSGIVDSVPMKKICNKSKLASVWREIQGLNNWDNMVEPLDSLLRQEIIRYGEFVTACYEAFDFDPNSKRYLNCKYGKRSMLREVGLGDYGYEVTKYIYATAPDINIPMQASSDAKWIGYVAVSTDKQVSVIGRRDIVITFRGTVTNPEWMANLMSSLTPARLDPHNHRPDVKVEEGFLSLYTSNESSSKFGVGSCREQLLSEITRLLNKYKDEEISITLAGHSMGSSLALLLAYDIAELGLNNRPYNRKGNVPVTVFSFAGPRVGNSGFKERCEELGVKVLRIVNVNDPITKLPGVVFNENLKDFPIPWRCSCYSHVGVELVLDFFKMHNPSCVHDLGNYIDLLKCPKRGNDIQDEEISLMQRAKGFLMETAQSLEWRSVAISVLSLVQSQLI